MGRYTGKLKGISYLHQRLKEEGITNYKTVNNFRIRWLYPLEKAGRLILPRSATNGRDRLMTEEQVESIVIAFSPDGVGNWVIN